MGDSYSAERLPAANDSAEKCPAVLVLWHKDSLEIKIM